MRPSIQSSSLRVVAAGLVLTLGLAACGGHSAVVPAFGPTTSPSNSSGGQTKVRTGRIALPPGSPINPGSLIISNSLGDGTVSSSGSYQLTVFGAGPQFAMVRNAAGNVVMTAFLSDAEPDFSAHSTAGVTLFFALGAFNLPATYQLQVLAQFATLPGEPNVEAAIASALGSSGGDPLVSSKSAISATVQSVVSSVRATAPLGQAARPLSVSRKPQGVVVDPSGQVGGLTLITDFPNAVHFQNAWRLVSEVYVDETAPYQKSLSTLPPYTIDSVAPIDSFKSEIIDIVNGKFALSQIASNPISLPSELGTDGVTHVKTTYQLTVIGPGSLDAAFPIPGDFEIERENLVFRFFIQNVIVPAVYAVIFPLGTKATDAHFGVGSTDQIRDLISAITTDAPGAATQMFAGDYKGAWLTIFNAMVTSNQMTSRVVNDVLAGATAAGIPYTPAQASVGASLAKGIAIFDIIAGGADLVAVLYAVSHSHKADRYTVVTTPEKVTLTPPSSTIRNDDVISLTAKALNAAGSGQTISYAFTNKAANGHLSDSIAGHQDNFGNNTGVVTYTANHTGQGDDTVNVTVTSTDPATNAKTTIGTASATVTVNGSGQVTLTPAARTVFRGKDLTLVASVVNPPADAALDFEWTNSARFGHDRALRGLYVGIPDNFPDFPNLGTSSSSALYTAGNLAGTDIVAVEVFVNAPNGTRTSLGRASAQITVDATGAVTINPTPLTLQDSDAGTLTATVASPPPNTNFEFHWSNNNPGKFGTLVDHPGSLDVFPSNDFTDRPDTGIASDAVSYQPNGTAGTDNVTVEVFATINGTRTSFGVASAAVTIPGKSICNGDFSQGFSCWQTVTVSGGGFSGYPRFSTHAPACVPFGSTASIDVPGGADGYIAQSFTVPASATTLSFVTWGNADPVTASVLIADSAGRATLLDSFTPPTTQNARGGCTSSTTSAKSYAISQFQGQTVTLRLEATSFSSNGTFANFTNVAVQ